MMLVVSLNAPFGARCFLSRSPASPTAEYCGVLMHPLALGAFCLATGLVRDQRQRYVLMHPLALGAFCLKPTRRHRAVGVQGLNAPFGARCFLSRRRLGIRLTRFAGLNAPYGARCFLTYAFLKTNDELFYVLMHLMALGAF